MNALTVELRLHYVFDTVPKGVCLKHVEINVAKKEQAV